MRISDWSSDVCSSDLRSRRMARAHQQRRSARNDQSRRLSAARPTLDDASRDAVGRTAHRHAFGPFGDRRRRTDAIGFRRNASHELRTPLAAILGHVTTLQDMNGDADAQTTGRWDRKADVEGKRLYVRVDV